MNRNHVETWKIIVPNIEVQKSFHDVADSFIKNRDIVWNQAKTLIAIRDALLTKLLSGEIRVALMSGVGFAKMLVFGNVFLYYIRKRNLKLQWGNFAYKRVLEQIKK